MKSKIYMYLLNIKSIRKAILKLTFITLCLTLFNCENENALFNDYKFDNDGTILNCDNLDTKLYVEALLSFEDDIASFYDKKNKNIRRAHSFFIRDVLANRAKFEDIVSPHSMSVFEALQKDKDLWLNNNLKNYNADIFKCLSSNFTVTSLQTTFNALVSTNSMSPELFGAPLKNQVKNADKDRYMATYVALDYYYANLFDIDPSTIKEKTDFSKNEEQKNNQGNQIIIDQKKSQEEPVQ